MATNHVRLPLDQPIWDRFFSVSPLVVVASQEPDGTFDLAPKHMAMPLGWQHFYAFVCSPRHATYTNIARTRQFTVSFPRPSQVAEASFAAGPRCEDQSKPALALLRTVPATTVTGVVLEHCYLALECALHSVVDGFGPNSLIVGSVVAASADDEFLRAEDRDPGEQLMRTPLLAYVTPGRYAEIARTAQFPVPKGFSR